MRADLAAATFGRLLMSSAVEIAVADVDWDQLENSTSREEIRPLFASMLRATAASTPSQDRMRDFASLPPESLPTILVEHLKPALAQIRGIEESAIVPSRAISYLGLDSLMAL
jgi:hypothetical protein